MACSHSSCVGSTSRTMAWTWRSIDVMTSRSRGEMSSLMRLRTMSLAVSSVKFGHDIRLLTLHGGRCGLVIRGTPRPGVSGSPTQAENPVRQQIHDDPEADAGNQRRGRRASRQRRTEQAHDAGAKDGTQDRLLYSANQRVHESVERDVQSEHVLANDARLKAVHPPRQTREQASR